MGGLCRLYANAVTFEMKSKAPVDLVYRGQTLDSVPEDTQRQLYTV